MYEQGIFPSTFNSDHKWTFTTYKKQSWSPKSLNLTDLVAEFSDSSHLLKLEQLDRAFRYSMNIVNQKPLALNPDYPDAHYSLGNALQSQRFDQTTTPVAESGIEFITRKKTEQELLRKGKFPPCSE